MSVRRLTRKEDTYDKIRADILGGTLSPGERLRYADLAERYGVSMGVLREALSKLTEQGLVCTEPRRGSHVTSIDGQHLRKLTDARKEIEPLVLQHAINDGDDDWEAAVVAAHHRLKITPVHPSTEAAMMSDTWFDTHEAFHDMLLAGCSNPWLLAAARDVRAPAALYLRLSLPVGESYRDIPAEHAAITDAVLGRDAQRAVRLLSEHIEATTAALMKAVLGGK